MALKSQERSKRVLLAVSKRFVGLKFLGLDLPLIFTDQMSNGQWRPSVSTVYREESVLRIE